MEKYGFVYIWYDRKHKRYYIGCRWGNENDGYVCSSSWMRQGYKHRPEDFKRRILSRVYTNKKDLLKEEYKWLSKTKSEELGKRYYNLNNHHFGHWSADENKRLSVGQKISASPNRAKNISKANKGKPSLNKGKKRSIETIQKMKDNHSRSMLGKSHNEETKMKMSLSHIGKFKSEEQIKKSALSRTGAKRSEESRKRMSESQKGTKKPWSGGQIGRKDSDLARENKRLASLLREQKKREMRMSQNILNSDK
jgi:hypothetical protein